jgi:hypothetical protein
MSRRPRAPRTIIVLAKDQGSLYEFLKERQEAAGKGRVVLDQRVGERRRGTAPVNAERRRADRRAPVPDAARALMSVLGFAVLHPGDGATPTRGPAPSAPSRGTRHPRLRKTGTRATAARRAPAPSPPRRSSAPGTRRRRARRRR